MEKFTQAGDFRFEACPDYGKFQDGQRQRNIKKSGKTANGTQRFQRKTCRRTFTETYGTIFYRKRTAEHEILETLALIAEGNRISTLSRIKGHKEDTIAQWLREAAQHAEMIEAVLMAEFRIQSGQFWRYTMLNMDSRLRVARGTGLKDGYR